MKLWDFASTQKVLINVILQSEVGEAEEIGNLVKETKDLQSKGFSWPDMET